MNITFTGHGMDVTQALKEYTTEKLDKLHRHSDLVTRVKITYNIVHLDNIVEATILVNGHELHAKSQADDMYKAIHDIVGKLDRLILKHKEKSDKHRE